ncbi:MAG TPA: NUDIX domain-containing protein [Labilithrix sp.]|nr:NUDIX domain-containing protein [Labilithrix sp.]
MPLPEPPKVALEIVEDRSLDPHGFLTLKRYELVVVDQDRRSRPFRYDMVERHSLDAAVIAAHHLDAAGRPHVYLRSSIRPPVVLRPCEPKIDGILWELPAGLIEPGEEPRAGAARELEEELGFSLEPERMMPLGPRALPAPGFIGEIHFFFHVRVDPATRRDPAGDGSPVEDGALIESVPLDEALAACRRGELPDAKTELALRRLAEIL